MQYSQKYTLVSFLEPLVIGTEFSMSNWPLHITLADVFAIEINAAIEQRLEDLFINHPSLNVVAEGNTTLGQTNVVLIKKSNQLDYLHHQIIDLLELNRAKFNNPEYTREGFLPHSTIQSSKRLREGDIVEISTVSLVDMFPEGNWQQRKILKNFKLCKS